MSESYLCPICGDTTSSYMGHYRKDRLCKKHATEYKNGELLWCEKCKQWHYDNQPCGCQTDRYTSLPSSGFFTCVSCGSATNGYAFCYKCYKRYTEDEMLDILNRAQPGDRPAEEIHGAGSDRTDISEKLDDQSKCVIIDFNNKSKCITCGKPTDGLLFCTACYRKYKDKELLFRITNGTCVELLEEDYEGRYTCKDGHIVKSKSERDIDNYLFEHGISHAYERELPYGATDRETLHPDFYLPNYLGDGKHVYIEHWGYNENNIQYTKTKKFKMPIYRRLGITLICTYEKTDMGKIDTVLDRKLNKAFIRENEINYEETSSTDTPASNSKKHNPVDDLSF